MLPIVCLQLAELGLIGAGRPPVSSELPELPPKRRFLIVRFAVAKYFRRAVS
jgi:hypothetical protein